MFARAAKRLLQHGMGSLAQDPGFAALDRWVDDVMAQHEVRRVMRDLKLAELEMLLTVLQKHRPTPNDPLPAPLRDGSAPRPGARNDQSGQ